MSYRSGRRVFILGRIFDRKYRHLCHAGLEQLRLQVQCRYSWKKGSPFRVVHPPPYRKARMAPTALAVDDPHHLRCITVPLYRSMRKRVFDPLEVVFVQLDVHGTCILFEARHAAGPGDRNDIFMLTQNPRQGKLRRSAFLFLGEFA